MIRYLAITVILLTLAFVPFSCEQTGVKVGSKKFTESVVLGELLAHLSRDAGLPAAHYQELGGTQLVFEALRNGEIDVYAEYTGTIQQEILAGRTIENDEQMRQALQGMGILMSRPLGFNNSYALGMKRERAAELNLKTVSDLKKRPDLRFGFGNEFMDREDGWPGLQQHYGLSPSEVEGLDHDLAYRQLDTGAIDVMDIYTTDSKIKQYDIVTLTDDREYFPRYDALILYRQDLAEQQPQLVKSLLRLEGQIDEPTMMRLNAAVQIGKESESQAAADFLAQKFNVQAQVKDESAAAHLWKFTVEHIDLVRKSLIPAILFAIPLGVIASRYRMARQVILTSVGIIQTVPALALLVMLMKPVSMVGLGSIGAGSMNAVLALFLYSLLPIVRNTFAGLQEIPTGIHESAEAIGLPALARLRLIELPLASRTILAGIKTAAVMNIGFATLGALVGAGGYGQPILTGIRLNDNSLILQGAIAAAAMAILVQGLFELAERYLVPKGLRLSSS